MLKELFGFYVQGLGLALVLVLVIATFWLLYRAERELDQTAQAKKQVLYEAGLLCLMTMPLIAFAFMAILLMLKA